MYPRSNPPRGQGPSTGTPVTAFAFFAALLASCTQPGDTPVDPDTGLPTATTFSKSYGGPEIDIAHAVRATSDGGIVLVGHSGGVAGDGNRINGGDLWIGKLDANGNAEAQRLLGVIPAGPVGVVTEFNRARVTPDDGYVAVGSANGNIAVARFNAQGAVLWARTYSSGRWVNYEYPTGQGAVDYGRDVWPLPDGGFWVVADSRANLRDVRNIGFDGPNNDSDLFVNARSVVVMRLDADGNVRFQQRYTEDAFGFYDEDDFDYPLIRATANGDAVIARHKRFTKTVDAVGGTRQEEHTYTLVQRLGGDASLLWTREVSGDALLPGDLIQTDDAVDRIPQSPDPVRDGASDDGFLFAGTWAGSLDEIGGCARLVKLEANGEIEWDNGYDCGFLGIGSGGDETVISSLVERCEGTPPTCLYLLGGSQHEDDEAGPRGMLWKVFTDGTNLDSERLTNHGEQIVKRVSLTSEGAYRILTQTDDGGGVAQIVTLNHTDLGAISRFTVELDVTHQADMQFTPDGGALILSGQGGRRLARALRGGAIEIDVAVNPRGERTDRGLAVVEVEPGRFVVAGDSLSFNEADGEDRLLPEGWVAAYDLRAGQPERIVWQQRLKYGLFGQVSGMAAAGDGGVVVAGRFAGDIVAAKLDSEGRMSWQSVPLQARAVGNSTVMREVQRTPDGGFVVLIAEEKLVAGCTVARLDANGVVLWKRRYLVEDAGSIEPVDADGDGASDDGFVIAGGGLRQFELASVVRIDGAGEILWARTYRPDSLNRFEGKTVGFPRIRQLRDRGFVLAITELGTISTLDSEGEQQPYGQTNDLLLKVGADGAAQWGRIYGAFLDESVHDLDVAPDGSILVAGTSDSFGERTEAWLLKLGSDGKIGNTACNCFLGTLPEWYLFSQDERVDLPILVDPTSDKSMGIESTQAPLRTIEDFVTARQCLGNANPTTPTAPQPQFMLTVTQAGTTTGVVISTPRGIACGTGLGDQFCASRFPAGSRIELRADNGTGTFRRWESACDEDSGNTNPVCVVTLDRDRSIAVTFDSPAAPAVFPFRVAVQGDGRVSGEGLSCREDSPAVDCSRDYPVGRILRLTATADADRRFLAWTGDCQAFGAQTEISLTLDRPLECFAQFSGPGQAGAMIAVEVTGPGIVRDDTPAGIACRQASTFEECSEFYDTIRTVTLTATPDADQRLVGWGGACASFGAASTARLVTAQDQVCTAQFETPVQMPLLSVEMVGGPATARVESEPAGILCTPAADRDCTQFYPTGTEVLLRASPGAQFAAWDGCDQVIDVAGCRVTMNSSRTLTARFAQ